MLTWITLSASLLLTPARAQSGIVVEGESGDSPLLPVAVDDVDACGEDCDEEVVQVSHRAVGLADLHLHQWAELAHGERWYHGSAQGTPTLALGECGTIVEGETPLKRRHGQFFGKRSGKGARNMSKWGLGDERSDDVRGRHPPAGISTRAELPHFLGWPTSDSIAHQQAWEGWLRMAHDGLPFAWFVHEPPDGVGPLDNIQQALDAFYGEDHQRYMQDAQRNGVAGLNLAVVSLVHSNVSCRSIANKAALGDNRELCNDMDAVQRQYEAAIQWWRQNDHWASIVNTPELARKVIAEGRLAIVLSIEASDVFGPSTTVAQGAFRDGYLGAAEETDASAMEKVFGRSEAFDPVQAARAPAGAQGDRKAALKQYLDAFPMVSTLQPAHQLDNPFAGTAFISNSLLFSQQWRERRLGGCDKEEIAAWKYDDDEASLFPRCWQKGVATAGTPSFTLGLRRLTANLWPDRYSLPGLYERHARDAFGLSRKDLKQGMSRKQLDALGDDELAFAARNAWRNAYGLSSHGEELIDVMVDLGMPIDASHMSWAAVEDLDRYLTKEHDPDKPAPVPFYFSHSYPFEWNLLTREQNHTQAGLAMVKQRGGMVGMRPGDDEIRLASGSDDARLASLSTSFFHDRVASSDCMGTTLATGVYLSAYDGAQVATAFGTDLNGFVNQPGPTSQLRAVQPEGGPSPCVATVPSIGSEIGTRGLAHVGLLPQLYLQLLVTAREDHGAERAVQQLQGSAEAYIRMWEHARGQVGPRLQDAPKPKSAADWSPVLTDGGDLRTIVVRTRDGEQTLPLLRAIEATLPYHPHGAVEVDDKSYVVAYPQLPTTIGFLLGASTFGIYPDRAFFPFGRCKWAGTVIDGPRNEGCKVLNEKRKAFRKAHSNRDELPALMGDFDRVFPQRWSRGTEPLQQALGQVPPRVDGFPSAAKDFPTHAPVSSWVRTGEDHQACLSEPLFLSSPAPGVVTSTSPEAWVQQLSAVPKRADALDCYCGLLRGLTETSPDLLTQEERAAAVLPACVGAD